MFDVGFWELVLVGLVALLAFGPNELPRLARDTLRLLRKLRAATQAAGQELRRELQLDELDLPQVPRSGSLLNPIREAVEDIRRPLEQPVEIVEPGAIHQLQPPSEPAAPDDSAAAKTPADSGQPHA